MNWQQIITYGIVAVAFILVAIRAYAIFTGRRKDSGCPDCSTDCITDEEKQHE